MKKQKIRLVLRSYDHRKLDSAVREILRTVRKTGSSARGPIPLPTDKKIFTVLRSPNNDKKSREQFQLKTHKRVLDIEMSRAGSSQQVSSAQEDTVNALMKLHISPAVDVEIRGA